MAQLFRVVFKSGKCERPEVLLELGFLNPLDNFALIEIAASHLHKKCEADSPLPITSKLLVYEDGHPHDVNDEESWAEAVRHHVGVGDTPGPLPLLTVLFEVESSPRLSDVSTESSPLNAMSPPFGEPKCDGRYRPCGILDGLEPSWQRVYPIPVASGFVPASAEGSDGEMANSSEPEDDDSTVPGTPGLTPDASAYTMSTATPRTHEDPHRFPHRQREPGRRADGSGPGPETRSNPCMARLKQYRWAEQSIRNFVAGPGGHPCLAPLAAALARQCGFSSGEAVRSLGFQGVLASLAHHKIWVAQEQLGIMMGLWAAN